MDIVLSLVDVNLCTLDGRSISEDRTTVTTDTIFGWTITGQAETSSNEVVLKVQTKEALLQSSLKQLWEIERVSETSKYSSEDELALQHFEDTYIIQPDRDYSVLLPHQENLLPSGIP